MLSHTPTPSGLTRREMLRNSAFAALVLGLGGTRALRAASAPRKKVLFFSKCSNYQHSVVKDDGGNGSGSLVGKVLAEIGPKNGFDITYSKDGSLFTPEYLASFDAYLFFTSGDLLAPGTDKNPPMTVAGKAAFLDAIKSGKGFVGTHSAADSFHTGETVLTDTKIRTQRYKNFGDAADPYTRMIGGGFIMHSKQQVATERVVDQKFPGFTGLGSSFSLMEEWYSLNDFSQDLHVILAQETATMEGNPYKRPPYPSTWARMHGKGRVFYTSMAHRDENWASARFQGMLLGALSWATGNVDADVTPNISEVTPGAWQLPPEGA